MGCGNVIIAHDNPFNREVLGGSAVFFSNRTAISTAIDSADSGEADIASMKVKVVERVRGFYTWERITDHYCQLLSLVSSKPADRREVIQCAPVLSGDEASARSVVAD